MKWSDVLLPLTPVYGAVVRARATAYGRGWKKSRRIGVPVVSVGNLTFGGTGKTPTVIALVRDLVRRGRRPAVLTRGYGRTTREPLVVVGPDPSTPPGRAGDEPLEMASRLPGVPIVVDSDRVRGGRKAVMLGATILVLDDGFQNHRTARDLDLVLIDAGDPWGGGRLPPGGRLREPVTALRRASAVLITKMPADPGSVGIDIAERVRDLAGEIPVLAAHLEPSRVRDEAGWQSPETLAGRRVFAFAGVGRPSAFEELLKSSGARIVATRWFSDHHRYRSGEVKRLLAEAERLQAVAITTAKDAVKLPESCPAWVVEADMVPASGDWDGLWRLLPEVTA